MWVVEGMESGELQEFETKRAEIIRAFNELY
jgi:hypothetical protein